MTQRKSREYFAGSNSCYGFWPYFDSIAMPQDMTRLLIKGGPGFGKSTLMKKIGTYFEQRGYTVEWFRCPSDPDSMDAVAIPEAGFCVIDATAPHALVPVRPKDEILNLWEYWEAEKHTPIQDSTLAADDAAALEKLEGQYEKRLHQARQEWAEQEKIWREMLHNEIFYPHIQREIKYQTKTVEEQFFRNLPAVSGNTPVLRHLFAAGLTPDGVVQLSDRIFDTEWEITGITCCMQPVTEAFMQELAEKCQTAGHYTELYHSPADPRQIDMVALPNYRRAVVVLQSFGIDYRQGLSGIALERKVELCESVLCQPHLHFLKTLDQNLITQHLENRRKRHYAVEERYQQSMNYPGVAEKTEQIIRRFAKR